MHLSRSLVPLVVSALVAATACRPSPDLGRVSGRVTWQGEPVAHATVTFQPSQGIASYGITDDDGHYELKQNAGRDGALIGTHSVSIETYRIATDEAGAPREYPETIPARYNAATELSRAVESGEQTIDFPLPLN